jgi:hypothetical protein
VQRIVTGTVTGHKTSHIQIAMFKGMSTLRAEEDKKVALQANSGVSAHKAAMQAYLQRYAGGSDAAGEDTGAERKKRKRRKVAGGAATQAGAIRIIDEDESLAASVANPAARQQRAFTALMTMCGDDENDDVDEDCEWPSVHICELLHDGECSLHGRRCHAKWPADIKENYCAVILGQSVIAHYAAHPTTTAVRNADKAAINKIGIHACQHCHAIQLLCNSTAFFGFSSQM